jgi:hypothetical protein
MPSLFKWSLSFKFSNQNLVQISLLCHAYYIPDPSQSPSFDHSSSMWWRGQTMKLLIMQTSADCSHFIPTRFKYKYRMSVNGFSDFDFLLLRATLRYTCKIRTN